MRTLIKALQVILVVIVLLGTYLFFQTEIHQFYNRYVAPRISRSARDPEVRKRHAEQCRDNLHTIDRAKTAWARANNKIYGEHVEKEDILPYLSSPSILVCPSGGIYTLHPYGTSPKCSIGINSTPTIQEDNHIIGIR